MALRLSTENIQAGMQMAQGGNPTVEAIKGVIQRYKDLRAQKEQIAGQVSLHKQKLGAEYDVKKELMGNFKIPEGYEASGLSPEGFAKGYKKIGVKDILMNKVLKGGKQSLSPNETVLWDELMRSDKSLSGAAFEAVGSPTGGTPTGDTTAGDIKPLMDEYNTTNNAARLKELEAILAQRGVTFQ